MAILVDRANARQKCSPFLSYASSAVIAEQNGEFQKAAEVWGKALFLSSLPVNREWVGSRIEFCANAARRGWGVNSESEGV